MQCGHAQVSSTGVHRLEIRTAKAVACNLLRRGALASGIVLPEVPNQARLRRHDNKCMTLPHMMLNEGAASSQLIYRPGH